MKRRFVLGLFVTLASRDALAQDGSAQGWSDYRSEDGNFHVRLPGRPAINTAALPIGNNETAPATEAVLRLPGATYQVVHVVYPRRISSAASADLMLDTFRNNMSSGMSWRSESKIALGRFPGREFVMVASDKLHTAVRLYWIRGKLYQLLVSGRPGIESKPDTRQFFDSFALNQA